MTKKLTFARFIAHVRANPEVREAVFRDVFERALAFDAARARRIFQAKIDHGLGAKAEFLELLEDMERAKTNSVKPVY